MKQKLLLLISVLLFQVFASAQGTEQMVFKNDFREVSGGLGNLTSMFMTDGWWSDANGDEASVIRVKVVDMSVSEMKKLNVKGSANLGIGKKQFFEKEQVWLIAVSAGSNMFLEMIHPTYGTSSRLNITEQLKARAIYDVTLVNNKTTTIVVRSIPSGADVYLDGDKKGTTPCEIPAQRLGQHELKLLYNGNSLVQNIDVEEGHTVFDKFDFRERVMVDITSDPSGAAIYVDNEMIGKSPVRGYNVILGAHNFKAVLNASQIDEQSINVTSSTTLINLLPVKKGNVHVTTKYGGRTVAATLVVDNEKNYTDKTAYDVILPYKQHSLRVSYGGKTKEKTIKVNKPQMNCEFKLSAKNSFVWPWQRSYNARPIGISVGYVSKQCIIKGNDSYDGQEMKVDPAYKVKDKTLKGIQAGVFVNPALSFGLGLYSGIFYEYYHMTNSDYAQDKFSEHSLNIPFHASFRIPFSDDIALHFHGGLGLDYGLSATYSGGDSDAYNSKSEYYGDNGMKRLNMSLDIAGGFNVYGVMFSAFYSKGITKHDLSKYGDTTLNKIGFSIAFVPKW